MALSFFEKSSILDSHHFPPHMCKTPCLNERSLLGGQSSPAITGMRNPFMAAK
jgi:hypothetical protein